MIESKITANAESEKKAVVCGVIGAPVGHSLSPLIHKHFAQQCNISLIYQKIHGIEERVKKQIYKFFDKGGVGLNVTLPFKSIAFNLSVHHTAHALSSGVANTLWRNIEGELCADNTDGLGLLSALDKRIELMGKRVLVLGAGGAAQGVIPSLLDASLASLTVANRSGARLKALSKRFSNVDYFFFNELKPDYDVIINATSSSLNQLRPNIPFNILTGSFCMDMFYDLAQDTTFVHLCKEYEALGCMDGIDMLVGQAAESFQRWHVKSVDSQLTLDYLTRMDSDF